MKPEWYKPHLKVIMMGNSGVGKSSFMNRFVSHRFTNLFRATIGTDFLTKEISVDGRSVVLHGVAHYPKRGLSSTFDYLVSAINMMQYEYEVPMARKNGYKRSFVPSAVIWDTAGTERFHSLGTAFFRASHCCLLVFDVTSTASFYALDNWLQEFLTHVEPLNPTNFPFVVVGNKTDLKNRQVSREQAQEWCKVTGAEYIEGSAKEDINVKESFYQAGHAALQYFEANSQETDHQIQINEKPNEIRQNKCQC